MTGCVAQGRARRSWTGCLGSTSSPARARSRSRRARRGRAARAGRRSIWTADEDPVYQFRQIARESPSRPTSRSSKAATSSAPSASCRSRGAGSAAAAVRILDGAGARRRRRLHRGHAARPDGERVPRSREGAASASCSPGRRDRRASAGVRFLTSHPAFVDDDLVDALAAGGADRAVLSPSRAVGLGPGASRMKRRYTSGEYRATVERIRARGPDLVPLLRLHRRVSGGDGGGLRRDARVRPAVRFGSLFGFLYSPRPGTAAARWGSDDGGPRRRLAAAA